MSQNTLLLGSLALGVVGAIGIVATVAALGDDDASNNDGDIPTSGQPGGAIKSNALHEARLDLARRLGIDPEDVRLVSMQHTGWDGCLGVVVENGVCTEIFIAGTIANFGVEEKTYRYHIGDGRFIATDFAEGGVQDGIPLDGDMVPDSDKMLSDYLRGDLALQLDVDIDDVKVASFEHVKWSDGCIGVHHPAASCLQGIVEGYLAFLEVDGQQYRYHGSIAGAYVDVWALSDEYMIVDPIAGDDGQGSGGDAGGRIKEPRQAMREDLAEKLGVDVDDVEIEDFDEVIWPDGCVGVYRHDALCTQALVDGWLAFLKVDGDDTEYRYHGTYDGGFIAVWELDPDDFRLGEPIDD